MTRKQAQHTLEVLEARGFDLCKVSRDGRDYRVSVRCSQCQALVINYRAAHETGCPNQRRAMREDDEE